LLITLKASNRSPQKSQVEEHIYLSPAGDYSKNICQGDI